MSSSSVAAVAVFTFIAITLYTLSAKVSAKVILEEGYTVTTILDGHKLGFNPYSLLPQSGSSSGLIILDSSSSTFYTVSFSNSPGVIEKLSGNGIAGYSDGDLASAMFDKPRSFAVDLKNNVYVADKKSHTIRKISLSGVTTIAGGYTKKTGNADGPAQNASFSDDFELSFIPQRCALMISDRGNQLVRQINLKAEDCSRGSDSVLRTGSMWAVSLGVACLFGLIIGFVVRPYILPHEGLRPRSYRGTWKLYLINLGKQIHKTLFFDIKSVTANSNAYGLVKHIVSLSYSYLCLMFGLNLFKKRPAVRVHLGKSPVSLLDSDVVQSSETANSQMLTYGLQDLVTSIQGSVTLMEPTNTMLEQKGDNKESNGGILSVGKGRIDNLIQANIVGFAEQGNSTSVDELRDANSGLF